MPQWISLKILKEELKRKQLVGENLGKSSVKLLNLLIYICVLVTCDFFILFGLINVLFWVYFLYFYLFYWFFWVTRRKKFLCFVNILNIFLFCEMIIFSLSQTHRPVFEQKFGVIWSELTKDIEPRS